MVGFFQPWQVKHASEAEAGGMGEQMMPGGLMAQKRLPRLGKWLGAHRQVKQPMCRAGFCDDTTDRPLRWHDAPAGNGWSVERQSGAKPARCSRFSVLSEYTSTCEGATDEMMKYQHRDYWMITARTWVNDVWPYLEMQPKANMKKQKTFCVATIYLGVWSDWRLQNYNTTLF